MSWFSSGCANCWPLVTFDIYLIQRGFIKYGKTPLCFEQIELHCFTTRTPTCVEASGVKRLLTFIYNPPNFIFPFHIYLKDLAPVNDCYTFSFLTRCQLSSSSYCWSTMKVFKNWSLWLQVPAGYKSVLVLHWCSEALREWDQHWGTSSGKSHDPTWWQCDDAKTPIPY